MERIAWCRLQWAVHRLSDAERPEKDAILAANHTECLLGAG